MFEFTVNGEARSIERPATISEFLTTRGIDERIVVVEYNGVILSRSQFAETRIGQSDNLEIVQMMAGG